MRLRRWVVPALVFAVYAVVVVEGGGKSARQDVRGIPTTVQRHPDQTCSRDDEGQCRSKDHVGDQDEPSPYIHRHTPELEAYYKLLESLSPDQGLTEEEEELVRSAFARVKAASSLSQSSSKTEGGANGKQAETGEKYSYFDNDDLENFKEDTSLSISVPIKMSVPQSSDDGSYEDYRYESSRYSNDDEANGAAAATTDPGDDYYSRKYKHTVGEKRGIKVDDGGSRERIQEHEALDSERSTGATAKRRRLSPTERQEMLKRRLAAIGKSGRPRHKIKINSGQKSKSPVGRGGGGDDGGADGDKDRERFEEDENWDSSSSPASSSSTVGGETETDSSGAGKKGSKVRILGENVKVDERVMDVLSWYDHVCFKDRERPDAEYKHTLCLFDHVFQREQRESNFQAREFSLGKWAGFVSCDEFSDRDSSDENFVVHNHYRVCMKFDEGDMCPGDVARSTVVSVGCGITRTLYNIQEPSTCSYRIRLDLPALCPEVTRAMTRVATMPIRLERGYYYEMLIDATYYLSFVLTTLLVILPTIWDYGGEYLYRKYLMAHIRYYLIYEDSTEEEMKLNGDLNLSDLHNNNHDTDAYNANRKLVKHNLNVSGSSFGNDSAYPDQLCAASSPGSASLSQPSPSPCKVVEIRLDGTCTLIVPADRRLAHVPRSSIILGGASGSRETGAYSIRSWWLDSSPSIHSTSGDRCLRLQLAHGDASQRKRLQRLGDSVGDGKTSPREHKQADDSNYDEELEPKNTSQPSFSRCGYSQRHLRALASSDFALTPFGLLWIESFDAASRLISGRLAFGDISLSPGLCLPFRRSFDERSLEQQGKAKRIESERASSTEIVRFEKCKGGVRVLELRQVMVGSGEQKGRENDGKKANGNGHEVCEGDIIASVSGYSLASPLLSLMDIRLLLRRLAKLEINSYMILITPSPSAICDKVLSDHDFNGGADSAETESRNVPSSGSGVGGDEEAADTSDRGTFSAYSGLLDVMAWPLRVMRDLIWSILYPEMSLLDVIYTVVVALAISAVIKQVWPRIYHEYLYPPKPLPLPTQEELESYFLYIITDTNGKISRKEFMKYFSELDKFVRMREIQRLWYSVNDAFKATFEEGEECKYEDAEEILEDLNLLSYHEDWRRRFSFADGVWGNSDGNVDVEEILVMVLPEVIPSSREKWWTVYEFGILDVNDDGKATWEEFSRFMTSYHGMTDEVATDMLDLQKVLWFYFDQDEDNALSPEEFGQFCRSQWAYLQAEEAMSRDRDGDGQISKKELLGAAKHFKRVIYQHKLMLEADDVDKEEVA